MKSECSIIDSDSDSCCSSNYEEEQDAEYDKEEEDYGHKTRKDNEKGKEHNQHEDNLDNDGGSWNEEPMNQHMSMIKENANPFKEENRDAKRTTLQIQTSTAEPHSVHETYTSAENVEMQDGSVIATGQHRIWI